MVGMCANLGGVSSLCVSGMVQKSFPRVFQYDCQGFLTLLKVIPSVRYYFRESMFRQDFFFILNWWLVLFGLGLAFLPLTLRLFNSFWDKGWLFSKVLAIAVTSYSVWLLGSLHLAPFTRGAILAVVGFWILVNWGLIKIKTQSAKRRTQNYSLKLKTVLRGHWKLFIFEEILFALCLLAWSWVRANQPDILGLEKFMDFGFINSILRSEYFPPADMWFAGKTINYYYFGHFVAAFLTRLSNLESAVTYNLMIATIFAFTFGLGFSLGSNFYFLHLLHPSGGKKTHPTGATGTILAGLISALLLTLGGNLHTAWWLITYGNFNTYWYPDETRFIGYNPPTDDKTIHEFPMYSFTVSDLHSHVSDLPFVLLFLGLLLAIFHPTGAKRLHPSGVLLALVLAVMYMTNSADALMYFAILGMVVFWLATHPTSAELHPSGVKHGLLFSFLTLALAFLFSLPFQLNFKQLIKGIALVHSHSPLWQLTVLYGGPVSLFLTFVIFLFGRRLFTVPMKAENIIKVLAALFSVKIKVFRRREEEKRGSLLKVDFLAIILGLFALAFILAPEVLYFKDIYIASHYRSNTMLKFSYQAFIILSLLFSYFAFRCFSLIRSLLTRILFAAFAIVLFTAQMSYPYFAIKGYYGGLREYKGLYGLKFLERNYPDDDAAILWLKENVKGQPVILEAVGESYTDYARVSMSTGLPTVVGWPVHEWLWRGSYDEPGKRREEVRQIYELEDAKGSRKLLDTYKVGYVFLGELERKQYSGLKEEKFKDLGELVFSKGGTEIYRVK